MNIGFNVPYTNQVPFSPALIFTCAYRDWPYMEHSIEALIEGLPRVTMFQLDDASPFPRHTYKAG